METADAQRIIESFRKGIPPDGYVRHFTVGRETEINKLTSNLTEKKSGAILLKANYGAGKTHLLRFIRETALSQGYVVSTVTLDAKSAVRFNRMDQVIGAVFRGLEIPNSSRQTGVRPFFDLICEEIEKQKANGDGSFWAKLTNDWRWNFSEMLDSPAFYLALRAWASNLPPVHDLIADWLSQSNSYKYRRALLYRELVEELRPFFRDPRQEKQFYIDAVFSFDLQGYSQSWASLRDIHSLSLAVGLKGLIILFDEFEDVLSNLNNIAHQQSAFWNLFQFGRGEKFPGQSFFAVTPEFGFKCKQLLENKGCWDYDYSQFDDIPTFQMRPLDANDLETLSLKILTTHGIAYDWEPDLVMKQKELKSIVNKTASIQVEDRARLTIREVVKSLDSLYQDLP